MIQNLCPHCEEADSLYRVGERLLCIDCTAYEVARLEELEGSLKHRLARIRQDKEELNSLVGYAPSGTPLIEDHMTAARTRVRNEVNA